MLSLQLDQFSSEISSEICRRPPGLLSPTRPPALLQLQHLLQCLLSLPRSRLLLSLQCCSGVMLLHLFQRLLSLIKSKLLSLQLNQFSSEIYRRPPGLLLLQHLLQCLLSLPHSRLQLSLQLEQYRIKICRRTSVLLLLLHLFQQSVATVLASVKVPAVATKVTMQLFMQLKQYRIKICRRPSVLLLHPLQRLLSLTNPKLLLSLQLDQLSS